MGRLIFLRDSTFSAMRIAFSDPSRCALYARSDPSPPRCRAGASFKGGDEVKQFYADRLFDGETSRWVAERAFQCAITDTELQAKLLDSAERWLIKDERSLAARMLLVHASLAQKHPKKMAERLLFELAELPTQARIHRRMGAAELYGLRLAIAQVATEVDPVHAREHYERVLSQNLTPFLHTSLARLSARLDEPRAAVEYGQSYLWCTKPTMRRSSSFYCFRPRILKIRRWR